MSEKLPKYHTVLLLLRRLRASLRKPKSIKKLEINLLTIYKENTSDLTKIMLTATVAENPKAIYIVRINVAPMQTTFFVK